jgi:hypothetical protein
MLRSLPLVTTLRRAVLVAAVCAVAALSCPAGVQAGDDTVQTGGAAGAAPANPAAHAPGMTGCKDAVNGECCGTCQEKATEDKPADHAAGDCPCKRAKQAQKGS